MAKKKRKSSKRVVKRAKTVCPKRYKGAKVRSKRMKGGLRCYIVKRNGQWRFVPKKTAGRKASRRKSR